MREIPTDLTVAWAELGHSSTSSGYRPFTPIEALMITDADSVQTSVMELVAMRELLNDALEQQLAPLELWIFNAFFIERKSLRTIGRELAIPKTTIARIRDRSTEKLRAALQDNPVIKEYLQR